MKSNLLKRTVTGILFVIILVGCTLCSPYSFTLLFALVSALTVYEFAHLVNAHNGMEVSKYLTSIAAAYLFLATARIQTTSWGIGLYMP